MGNFELSNGEYVVGKKQDGSLVNVLSYNFVNNTYQVIGLGGESLTHTVEGRTIELLPELMSYKDENGNQTSIFKGSVIKTGDTLRVIVDVDAEDERVCYKVIEMHELFSDDFDLENIFATFLYIDNFSTLIKGIGNEFKIYSSLESFERFSDESRELAEKLFYKELIEQDIDELFENTSFVHGFMEDEDTVVSVWKNDLADDEYDIVFSQTGLENLENYRYKRVTVDKETLIDMIEDSTLFLMEDNLECECDCDDFCSCLEEYDDDEEEDWAIYLDEDWEDFDDEELDELTEEEIEEFELTEEEIEEFEQLLNRLELEDLITEITGEPFDLDVLFASTPDEVYMEHMSMLEFKEYQLEMMETFLKASKLIEFEDESINELVTLLENNIGILKMLINITKKL